MGLCVTTALELLAEGRRFGDEPDWLLADLEKLNALLRAGGLPPHHEGPDSEIVLANRAGVEGFPYSFLAHLRRAYGHLLLTRDAAESGGGLLGGIRSVFGGRAAAPPPLTPFTGADVTQDPWYERALVSTEHHVLFHSDCEGYYVPVDFAEPLVADDEHDVTGVIVGSSHALSRELVELAPPLGIRLGADGLADAEAERINALVETDGGFARELCAWIGLYESARISVEHGTAIVFT